ncbi:hypothetical protein BCR42DRAFT_453763 [Absidia repens]|uniref:GAR domain-containing protein n=1 Tax=Absidia repens TaxID=90262 RepID=A0A1X2I8N5_9FUNG|nr:hypothetical protein BCR42DRAFT_453763 [Absidia repens]
MTSLLSTSLNTLPNDISISTTSTPSIALHPHTPILSRILMAWVDARFAEHTRETVNTSSSTNDTYSRSLLVQLLHEQLPMDHIDSKNSSIISNHYSDVAQIVDILLENENSAPSPSIMVEDLASTLGNEDKSAALEIVSCIILKTFMRSILVGGHFISATDQDHPLLMPSTIPTFKLGHLSLQHTFLEVRSALLSWVNQQFRNNINYVSVDLVLDFGKSWSNGLAFTILIYCLNQSYLSNDLQLWVHQRLQLGGDGVSIHDDRIRDDDSRTGTVLSCVFDIARQRMGVSSCHTLQDMLEMLKTANEWCIILYIYEFYMYALQQKGEQQQQQSTSLISDLQQALELVCSVSHTKNDKNVMVPLHPLDDIDEPTINDYSQKVSSAVSLWNIYLSKTKNPSPQLMTSITAMRQAYDFFTQGLAFAQLSKEIQAELNMVESALNGLEYSLTMDSVHHLEEQVHNVKSLICDMEEQFGTLVQQQERYRHHLHQLDKQANLVCGWTRQVHTSMVENNRIWERIVSWIDLIEEKNALITGDGSRYDATMATDLSALDHIDMGALYHEHEQLKKDLDQFEAADGTKQLRAYIKQHTDERQQRLTPADISTLSVSLVTLNMLDRLWQLMADRGQKIERLVCRLQWEHRFEMAVEWIFLKDAAMDRFLRSQALWCEQNEMEDGCIGREGMAEQIIDVLMQLEHDISDFDDGAFRGVWNAYQHMVDIFGNAPGFLKRRQTGFEAAFDDLTKRCSLARQVVEQHLAMMDMVTQFKRIKNDGDALRRKLLMENDALDGTVDTNTNTNTNSSSNSNSKGAHCGNDMDITSKSNAIELCVEKFKEAYTDFLAQARTRLPYPDAPTMSTAMGATDAQSIDATNDAIRDTLRAYDISLSLISDGLDQLLVVRYHMQSLQRQAVHVCEQLERLTHWMDDRRGLIEKSDFDIYDGKNDDDHINLADFISSQSAQQQDKNDLLLSLEKELGTITYRLQQMENDDLAKLMETTKTLQSEMDHANTVSGCRHDVESALECLKTAQLGLKVKMRERGNKLEALKRYLAWESYWIKSHQWILSATRKLWDFCVKKARYCPSAGDSHVGGSSSVGQHDLEMALHSHQDRITDIGGSHMAALANLYARLVDGIIHWENSLLVTDSTQALVDDKNKTDSQQLSSSNNQTTYGFSSRQSMVDQEYGILVDLSQYAAALVTQRLVISNILVQLDDAFREGERLRDSLSKSAQQVTRIGLQQPKQPQQRQPPKEKVDLFRQLVTKIKATSTALEYPTFTPKLDESDSIISLTQIQQLHQDDEIRALIAGKMDQLENLGGQLTDLLMVHLNAEKKKKLVEQYNDDVLALARWIHDQTTILENRQLNVASETMDESLNCTSWSELDDEHEQFVAMIGSFESDRLRNIHNKVALLVEDVLSTCGSVVAEPEGKLARESLLGVTVVVTRNLGAAVSSFTALQQKMTDESTTLDAVAKRIEWTKLLQDAHGQLEDIQNRLIAWCKEKDDWVNNSGAFGADDDDDCQRQQVGYEQVLAALYERLENIMMDKDEFTGSAMVKVHLLYDTFVQCFPKLPRPTAIPDHIEDTMSSLDGSNARCQETLVSKIKELNIIQGCIQWKTDDKTVHVASKYCLDGLNFFVTHTARWRPLATEKEGRNGAQPERPLDDYSSIRHQQCTDLIQQLYDLQARLDILEDDVSANNVSNAIIQHVLTRRDQLVRFARYVSQFDSFVGLVVEQNKSVEDILGAMSGVGDELSLLLAGYKSDSMDYINLHAPMVPRDYYDQLTKQVDQLRSRVSKVIYPVRPAMNQPNTSGKGMVADNNASYWIALDHTDNNVIRNIINGNLMDLEHDLRELDRIIHTNKQQHQEYTDLKQQIQSSNTIANTKKIHGKTETVMSASQSAPAGPFTKSLLINSCSMISLAKHSDRRLLKSRLYRAATKIMPGQVGKYWIGNSHPRLIYCRILKSNVVMARVGGGWVELSQFLLDHGCNDGFIISDTSVSAENIFAMDGDNSGGYENVAKSESSASLTLSRSSGKSSTSTRSLLSLTGYTDGYQYVRIDEWGNHLALNMVRVDDHYFIPQK